MAMEMKGPNTRSKWVITMSSTQAGQSRTVGTKSGPPGLSEVPERSHWPPPFFRKFVVFPLKITEQILRGGTSEKNTLYVIRHLNRF